VKVLKAESFENVKKQIGYCGIWCGSCVVGNGALREVTKNYEQMIKSYGLSEWGPKEIDFKAFMNALDSIQAMPLCQGCCKGDGKPNCEFRACATKKRMEDCNHCDQTETCENSEALKKMRTGALEAGLKVKTEKVEKEKLIRKWIPKLKRKWPHSILFISEEE
jgi:hypothetical protein